MVRRFVSRARGPRASEPAVQATLSSRWKSSPIPASPGRATTSYWKCRFPWRRRCWEGEIRVPTPAGEVIMSVPRGSNTGTTLRLKGKGAPRRGGGSGDELVKLKIILPRAPDPELEAFVSNWAKGKAFNPREGVSP